MKIKVINPGLSTTIQDSGRMNGLAFGVPLCGAMDINLMYFANSLVGNPISNPTLELTLDGGLYEFQEDALIAIGGFENDVEINGVKAPINVPLQLKKGDLLRVKQSRTSRYSYLAIAGMIKAEEYWGSYSTYEFANKGGFWGRRLKKGDELIVKSNSSYFKDHSVPYLKNEIRLCRGPEYGEFSLQDINGMVSKTFDVSVDSNRMGYRLEGDNLEGTTSGNIISSGVIPGTIQVPKSGSPIVLMSDSPCTGGYPRIAIVHPDDLGSLAQKLPNDPVKFVWHEL